MPKTPAQVAAEIPATKQAQEILAAEIIEMSNAVKKILDGPLQKRTLLLLISDASGVPMKTVSLVLQGMEDLKHNYIKKISY